MADVITVLIVDDHPVVRQGLRTFLESRQGIEVVAEAADGEQAVARAARLRPDVVLMDLVMPRLEGVQAITRIVSQHPDTKVIVLTSFAGGDKVVPAVQAGAAGYLLKDVDPGELEAAIRAVHRGESLLHPSAAAELVQQVRRPGAARGASLTPREREVLAALARGRSNREVARELVVSEKTVKSHVSSILAKLGVADRTQAALWAVREGFADQRRASDGGPATSPRS